MRVHDLWPNLLSFLRLQRISIDDFGRRHRLDCNFLEQLRDKPANVSHRAARKLHWLVSFGPALRADRVELRLSLRDVADGTGISTSKLSRAERFLTDLTSEDKKRVSHFLRAARRRAQQEQVILDRRRAASSLRKARRKAGISQERLAELVGRERKAVIRWEATGCIPPASHKLLNDIFPGWLEKQPLSHYRQ